MATAARWYRATPLLCAVLGMGFEKPYRRPEPPLRWTIHERASLAWWQINPSLGHLWATTCRQEPTWQPGREEAATFTRPKTKYAVLDTVIPLYPRPVAQDICAKSGVRGELTASDTVSWRGVRGHIEVDVRALTTGRREHDAFMHTSVFQAGSFPLIEFRVDSVVGVERIGDTVTATAMGVFTLRRVDHVMSVAVRVWREPLGLRVTGKGEFPATDLCETYGMSRKVLGMGVVLVIWKKVHWGLDAILVPANGDPAN